MGWCSHYSFFFLPPLKVDRYKLLETGSLNPMRVANNCTNVPRNGLWQISLFLHSETSFWSLAMQCHRILPRQINSAPLHVISLSLKALTPFESTADRLRCRLSSAFWSAFEWRLLWSIHTLITIDFPLCLISCVIERMTGRNEYRNLAVCSSRIPTLIWTHCSM